jgi:hypothetical protein
MKTTFCILILIILNLTILVFKTNMNLHESIIRMKTLMGLNEELIPIETKLKKGDRGNEVESLQDILGIYVDGIFGNQTERCLTDFQTEKKIEGEDGVVGIETIKYLQKIKDGTDEWESAEYCKTKFFNKNLSIKKQTDKGVQSFEEPEKEIKTRTLGSDAQIILMGGLDYRQGDKNISQQVEIVKQSSGIKNVIGHRYMKINDVLSSIKENPDAYVILFSAGCRYSNEIAKVMNDKSKLYIVEPYAVSSGTANSVRNAVSQGVPPKNVIVGPSKGRGSGVVDGSTKTPPNIGHWGSLEYVGTLL